MNFLSKKVAYYLYPRFALFRQNEFNRHQGIELVSYHHSQEEAEEMQRQEYRQYVISLLLDVNNNYLDSILLIIISHIHDSEEQFWKKIEDRLGIDATPNSTNPFLSFDNLLEYFAIHQDDYKMFISDMEFLFNQLNLNPIKECNFISNHLMEVLNFNEDSKSPNYYIISLPQPISNFNLPK